MSSTFRAFQQKERISTAVLLKDSSVLQVYPSKTTYESMDAWRAAWPQATEFKGEAPAVASADATEKPKKMSTAEKRREYEFAEFLQTDYKWLITSVTRVDEETLELTLNDTSKCIVKRPLNFCEPPQISRNDVKYLNNYSYSPAITAVRWLMMLMFVKPEEGEL